MPNALKIFIWSLFAGLSGGFVALRLGAWIAERWFPREPLAMAVALILTAGIGVASAVTAGVLMGKKAR